MSSGRVREKRPLDGFPVCAVSPSLIWSDVISLQGRESNDGVWSFPLAHLESNLETFVGLLINKALPAPSVSIFIAPAMQGQSQQSSRKSRVKKSQEALTLTLMKDTLKSVGSYFQLPVRSRFSTLFRCRLHFPNRRHTEQHIWNLSGTIPVVTFAAQKLDLAPAVLGSHPSKSTRPLKTTIVRMSDCSSPSALVTFKWIFRSCPHFWHLLSFTISSCLVQGVSCGHGHF